MYKTELFIDAYVDIFLTPHFTTVVMRNVYSCYEDWLTNLLSGLWNPEVQCSTHNSSPKTPILSRINQISRVYPYLSIFKKLNLWLTTPKGTTPVNQTSATDWQMAARWDNVHQRCLSTAIFFPIFLLLTKSVTWFFHNCCGISLTLLSCGFPWQIFFG